ncbi:hypothetical protein JD844_015049, partial [Phrynosoma platyrhinos]
ELVLLHGYQDGLLPHPKWHLPPEGFPELPVAHGLYWGQSPPTTRNRRMLPMEIPPSADHPSDLQLILVAALSVAEPGPRRGLPSKGEADPDSFALWGSLAAQGSPGDETLKRPPGRDGGTPFCPTPLQKWVSPDRPDPQDFLDQLVLQGRLACQDLQDMIVGFPLLLRTESSFLMPSLVSLQGEPGPKGEPGEKGMWGEEEGLHQLREALKILAERVLILETMIGLHEPEPGSGIGPVSASVSSDDRGKRDESLVAYTVISHRRSKEKRK